jgi:hypothetical protein
MSGADVNLNILGGRGLPGESTASYVGVFSSLPQSPSQGDIAIVTDVGLYGSLWIGSVAGAWQLPAPVILGQSNQPLSNYGGTGLGKNLQIDIGAGVLNSISMIKLSLYGSVTASTNSKQIEAQFAGSITGTFTFLNITTTNAGDSTFMAESIIVMRGSASQLARSYPLGSPGGWSYSPANVAGTIDITQATSIFIKSDGAQTGEPLILEACMLTAYP